MMRLRKAKRLEPVPFFRDPTADHSHPRRKFAPDIWSQVFGARKEDDEGTVPGY